MCMMFHIATKTDIPRIDWNKNTPAFNTSDLSDKNKAVLTHFSLPFVTYIGTDESCGCGFRHALRHDGHWIPASDAEDSADKNKRTYRVVGYLAEFL